MDLRGIANSVATTINPNIPIVVRNPNGYTIDPATRRQVPAYINTPGFGQVQALDGDDLKQISGLNIQGTIRAVYLYGNLAGVIRPDQKGNAEVIFDNRVWGVFKVLETWPTWCKVAVVYQEPAQ